MTQSGLNDGDSFLVRYGEQADVFRLYYVDAPETYDTYRQRILDQARYFSISESEVIAAGKDASSFTRKFLSGEFTLMTKWEDARGNSQPRYFAMVQKDGRYLSNELVRNGLARIYGMPTFERWPHGYAPQIYLKMLKNSERAAQIQRSGIWSAAHASSQLAGLALLNEGSVLNGHGDAQIDTYTQPALATTAGAVNINTASVPELETLPGIGPALAAAIVAARPFTSLEALVEIPGISANKLAAIRSLLILNEPLTARNTADFYRADVDQYLDTEVAVEVASLSTSDAECPAGFRALVLETAFEGRSGGSIIALIPDEFFESFTAYYTLPGREFKGLFYEYKGEKVLVYQRQ